MRKSILMAVLLITTMGTWAQKIANPKPYANTISAADLKKHLYIVAGAEMEGRETATEGQRRAAAYIEEQFRLIGVSAGNNGSFSQMFPVYQDSLVSARMEVNGKSFKLNEDFTLSFGSVSSSTLLAGEVVFVGTGTVDSARDDFKNQDVRGKVVLVLPSTAPATGNNRRNPSFLIMENALKNGAAAVLMVQSNFPRRPLSPLGFQTMNPFRKVNYPPTYIVSENVAKEIMGSDYATAKEALKAGNPESKAYQSNLLLELRKETKKMESSNVLGFIEGSDKKDEYLVITAHYDHMGKQGDSVIFYGADDDGSGTVAVIELAEAFMKAKKEGKGPRRSILFMAVSGEEKGLWGSAYYGDNPVYPLEKTTANLNIDMIGRIDPKRTKGDSTNYVYVVGDDKLSTDLRPISEAMNKKYTKLELDYKFNDPNDTERIYFRSDHYNFAKKGVPIIFYFNGTHADYHRPTDTPDKINYDLLEKRARLVFYTAWEMVNRNEMLKRDLKLEIPSR